MRKASRYLARVAEVALLGQPATEVRSRSGAREGVRSCGGALSRDGEVNLRSSLQDAVDERGAGLLDEWGHSSRSPLIRSDKNSPACQSICWS